MALTCKGPECDHEFADEIWHGDLEAKEAGETPFFTHVHEPDDGLGVVTSYLCSADCMRGYLDDLEDGGDDE
ncbi:hypothetical protein [Natronosalvus rutilus]|uniref:Uncharacterized protein n=1 Tax=Natronosalvus rutilus TaxID=2953753 RepID=A0A9E7SZM6_9EURY|nr:hypothetical protein [Natronosalvus rutilus]UTF56038.1 hypothetical protein NGM29_20845 [Natronosalvus rutilus]